MGDIQESQMKTEVPDQTLDLSQGQTTNLAESCLCEPKTTIHALLDKLDLCHSC